MSDNEDSTVDDLASFEESLREGVARHSVSARDAQGPLKHCIEILDRYRRTGRHNAGAMDDEADVLLSDLPSQIGRYAVKERLGAGASGVVFLAEDSELGRSVAIKILRPEGLIFSELRERFVRESGFLRKLRHPNVAEILDTGEFRGLPFIVSTFYGGSSLQERILVEETLEPEMAAGVAMQIASAAQFAHSNGIVHRDIKPSNVLVEPHAKDGDSKPFHIRLIDFGLASLYESSDAPDLASPRDELTRTGHPLGTVAYMSPEQAAGRRHEVGPQSDVWSIGVVLFEMITGRTVVAETSAAQLLKQVESSTWNPFREVERRTLQQIPNDLQTIVLKALATLPADRYPSAGDMAEDLSRFLQRRAITARRLTPVERLLRWTTRNLALASGVLAIAAISLITLFTVMSAYSLVLSNRADELAKAVFEKEAALANAQSAEAMAISRQQEAISLRLRAEESEFAARKLGYRYGIQTAFDRLAHNQLARANEFTLGQVPTADQPDVRGFEWQLLNAELQARVHYFGSHEGAATEVAVFANGRMAASVGEDGYVKIWDLVEETLVRQFNPQIGPIHAVAVSPDNTRLAVGDMASPTNGDVSHVYLLDINTGEELRTLHDHSTTVEAIDFSPDGQFIASASRYQQVIVSDLQGDGAFSIPTGKRCRNSTVSFSPNSKQIASIWSDSETRVLQIWDVAEKRKAFEIVPSTHGLIRDVRWRNNETVVISDAWNIEIWLIGENRRLVWYSLPEDGVQDQLVQQLAIDGDSDTQLVATDIWGHLHLWSDRFDIWGRKPNVDLGIHQDAVADVKLAGSSHVLTACVDGTLALVSPWGRPWTIHDVEFATTSADYDASSDSFFLGTDQGEIYRTNLKETPTKIYGPTGFRIQDLQMVNGQDTIAVVDELGAVALVNSLTGQPIRFFDQGDRSGFYQLSTSRNGKRLAVAGCDLRLRIFDLEDLSMQSDLDVGRQLQSVALSPDGNQVAVGHGDLTIFDVATGVVVREFATGDSVVSLCYDETKSVLASSHWDGATRFYDFATRTSTVGLVRGSQSVTMRFVSNGKRLLTMDRLDGQLRVWDVATGECLGSTPEVGRGFASNDFALGTDRILLFNVDGENRLLEWSLAEATESLWKRRARHDVAVDTKPLHVPLAAGQTVLLQNAMVATVKADSKTTPSPIPTKFFNGILWDLDHNSVGLQTFRRTKVGVSPSSPAILNGNISTGTVQLTFSPEPPFSGTGWYVHYVPGEQYTVVMECIFDPGGSGTHYLLAADEAGEVKLVEQKEIDLRQIPGNLKWRYSVLSQNATSMTHDDLDLRFGTNGCSVTDFQRETDIATGVAVQADGKFIVVGETRDRSHWDFSVARYEANGSLDPTFGVDGKVTTDFGTSDDVAHDVVVQPDGKIVVVGHSGPAGAEDFAVARYNSDGSLDTTFGTNGFQLTNIWSSGSADLARCVSLQSDGKIVVAGQTNGDATPHGDFAVVRYNADGSLDPNFNNSGTNSIDFAADADGGYDVAIDNEGRILVTGFATVSGSVDIGLVRLTPTGNLDVSFGLGGRQTTDFTGTTDFGRAISIQDDGKIVVGGSSYNGSDVDFAAARYDVRGNIDASFGSNGRVTTKIGPGNERSHDVLLQPDGRIILVGYSNTGTNNDFAATRYYSTGILDTTFGNQGTLSLDLGGDDFGYRAAWHGYEHILIVGESTRQGQTDFATVRLNVGSETSQPASQSSASQR